MVQRNSEAVQFRTGDAPRLGQQRVGNVGTRGPDTVRVGEDDGGWKARLFQDISRGVQQAAFAEFDARAAEDYLAGSAAVGSAESEAELEASPLTRDWAVAGFRDTTAKLKQAEMGAKLAQDMITLREKDPQEFLKRLAADRAELLQGVPGMSREQRAAMIGQVALNDRAAVKLHAQEHTKFLIEQQQKAERIAFLSTRAQLDQAREDKNSDAYVKAVEAAGGRLIGGLWANPRIPLAQKQSMTQEWLEETLASDHPGVFEYIRDSKTPISGPDGTLYSLLDDKTRSALADKYRTTQERLAVRQNQAALTLAGQYEAERHLGTYKLTLEDAVDFGGRMVQKRLWDGGKYQTWIEGHYRAAEKANDLQTLAQAYVIGDIGTIMRRGADEHKALDAFRTVMKDLPLNAKLPQYLAAGDRGMVSAYKEVGEFLRPAIMQLESQDGTLHAENAATLQSLQNFLQKYATEGKTSTITAIKAGLGEIASNRLDTMQYYMGSEHGLDAQRALAATLKHEQDWGKISPQEKAAIRASTASEDTAFVQSIEPMDMLDRVFSVGKGIVQGLIPGGKDGSSEALRRQLAPGGESWWQTAPQSVLNAYAEQARFAVLEEQRHLGNYNPLLNAKDREINAAAAVRRRTIELKDADNDATGALILPKGVDPAQYFQLKSGDGLSLTPLLSRAIPLAAPPTSEDGRMVYYFSQGRLHAQEYDRKGVPTNNAKIIDPGAVREKVLELNRDATKQASAIFGQGLVVNKDGHDVQFNGLNSASVEPRLMLKFRQNLITNEGVKDVPYKDLSGKLVDGKPVMTVGVGVSSHNKRRYPRVGPDGKVSRREIERSFKGASDDAALAAQRVLNQYKRVGDDWFLLSAEMAYQSGPGFGDFDSVAALYRNADPAKAVELLRETPAWKFSGAARRKHYETLVTNAMR